MNYFNTESFLWFKKKILYLHRYLLKIELMREAMLPSFYKEYDI